MSKTILILISIVSLVLFLQADIAVEKNEGRTTMNIADTAMSNKLFSMADRFSQQASFDSAIIYYTKAASLFQSARKFDKYARCMVRISEQYIVAGVMDKAKSYADQAFISSLKHSNFKELGWSHNCIGTIYYNQGLVDSAIVQFNQAISTWEKNKAIDTSGMAEAYGNLASMDLILGNYEEALSYTEKALSFMQSSKSSNPGAFYGLYTNMGSIYYMKGYYKKAETFYKQSLEMALQLFPETHPYIGTIYINIGEIFHQSGDYNQALIYLQKAVSIFEASLGRKDERIGSCYINIGAVQILTGDYSEGLNSLRVALSIFSSVPGLGSRIALIYNSIGRVYRERNMMDSAEYYLTKSISKYLKESPRNPDLPICYSNLAELYCKTGKIDQALVNFKQALILNEKIFGTKHPNTALIYNNIADLYFLAGDYNQSLRYSQKAAISNVLEFNDTSIFQNPNIQNPFSQFSLLSILGMKATAFGKLYEKFPDSMYLLKSAFLTNQLATDLLDSIRIYNNAENSRVFMEKQFLQVYYSGLYFSYLLYKKTGDPEYLEKAFACSEKSRSALLYSSLKELEAQNIGGIPDSVQNIEKNLRLDLAFYEKNVQAEKLRKSPDMKKLRIWQDLQFSLNHSYDSLIRSFEYNYPEYYQLKYDLRITGIKEIQANLSERDILIEYALAENMLFTFIISPNTVSLISTAIDSGFNQNIDIFRQMILHKESTGEAVAGYCKVAGSLYGSLLKRVAPLMKNKNLIIIPDGKLGTIPFEGLLTDKENAANTNYKSLSYLIKEHAIGYGYSATIYMQSQRMKNRSSKADILAFAPSFKAGNLGLLAELKERGEEFVSLAGSKDEVLNIQRLYGGTVFLDTAATSANFKQFSPKYSILHISTHGIMNDEKPMQSKLVFYQKNHNSDDANLYAYEIFNMKLKADLVVLSACNTGYGKIVAGEGIMSLARGFMYAGVPSIISTLWSVNDQSTATIMKNFYKYLYEKDEKSVALQKAQIDYLNSADNITAHPFYWSGFLSIGNNQPVYSANPYIKWGIPVFILILLIFTLFWVKRKRKTKTE